MQLHSSIFSLIAFALCYVFIPVFGKVAWKYGLVTNITAHKIDKRQIPFLGGIAMFSVVFLLLIWAYQFFPHFEDKNQVLFFLLSAGCIVLFGLIDDVKELSPWAKLTGQFIAGGLAVILVTNTQVIYFNGFVNAGMSVFWIIIVANAFNLLDIMDGLSGSIALVNSLTFFIFGCLTGNCFVILVSVILAGVLIAFLRYNLPSAKVFMGDAGSQFLGFSQAVLAVSLSYASKGSEVGLVIPLVILSIPLFDMFFVILMRLKQKKSVLQKSNDHFVFRMLQDGMSKGVILTVMVLLTIITNIAALLIYCVSNKSGIIIFAVLMVALFLYGSRLSKVEINS
ncbi:MAG: undecaprenyl/decaprenyl-phosphate alpha-N-acetylglucosaminyl 1-phosphate transferase [Candidatus Omnitrophica bacterium]|nr:undecaprenyl/decaprenyl-phosphate alpha-N-acetylglucosaminyl 1-phosphate transferase [Candidatus Omnitrophota bacterium]